ncbi:uncharacterized protein LOC126841021 [Adelges cooleyi]|uniref:uncharacterized protein LOC126841021 n=1 Tax=Adelges cooleyi TaxID=133065 RepID=UPI00217FF62C|nr:uncharacterized protein LOC126841021 [Adelges cooleyi]
MLFLEQKMFFSKGIVVFSVLYFSVAFDFSECLECEPRPQPIDGQAVFTTSKSWKRAVEVYQCEVGYVLDGHTKHTCTEGQWSGQVPLCVRNKNISFDNNIGLSQGWFPFRHLLKSNAAKVKLNNGKKTKKKSTDDKTSSQASGYELPKQMIRNSIKEYSAGDYDLSCLFRKRHGKKFLRAPKLINAHVKKYAMKKNATQPYNKYLEAIYVCADGYVLKNDSEDKLFCSNRRWVGLRPICEVTRPDTVKKHHIVNNQQDECYIKCPPDKSLSLAEGAQAVDFKIDAPETNYDWQRLGSLSSGWSKNSSRSLVPGLYVITYTIQNQDNSDRASCRTTIRVTDDEPPKVRDCPLYLELAEDFGENDAVPVRWPEPVFVDNVSVTKITKTMEPGQLLSPALYNVFYSAFDGSGNAASCNFTLEIKDRTATFNTEKTTEISNDANHKA